MGVSDRNVLPENLKIHPCGVLSDEELKSAMKSGTPKESWPIKHSKDWSVMFGDENFGFEIVSNFDLNAEEKNNNLHATSSSNIEINIKILSETINAVNLKDRVFNNPFQNNVVLYLLNQKVVDDNIINKAKRNYYKNFEWETGIEFSLGPFGVVGSLNLNGGVGIIKSFNPSSLKLEDNLTPYVNLDLSGKLDVDFEIVEAGINGYIKFIKDTLSLMRELELKNQNLEGGYFVYNTRANNKIMEALKGKIYAYIDIDYLIDTKKFVFVFYNNERGISSNQNILTLNVSQPARRDRELYLEILNINGITNYTARNEKTNVVPISFEVSVDAGGQSFTEIISDWNNDGKIETPIKFKIPLLSSLSIPIKLSVREKYKIGKLQYDTPLDLAKGEEKELTFCYNPVSRKIFGSVNSEEEQEIIASGDKNYFGERYHSIKFKLIPYFPFKSAPGKAK